MQKKIFLYTTIPLITCCLLAACVNAAFTGASAVYNRHSIQQSLNDNLTSMKAERKIYVDTDQFKDTNVTVATFNNIVLLAGQVNSAEQKSDIERIVRSISDSDEIHNLISVSNTASSLTRISDSWITAKIKSKFLTANEIDPTQIKVLTENGTVYLMGIVPPEQAEAAVEIARTTAGVQSVVKVFSYIRISKK